jgi:ribonucleoside-diphosphate reductase alpha chain
MEDYSRYIAASRYARFDDEKGRRESWEETVNRLIGFWKEHLPEINDKTLNLIGESIKSHEIMPSMRTLMTAGEALKRDNVAAFNCSYTVIESLRDFDEILYVLMCGTGVGFSVESRYTNQLPSLPDEFHRTDSTIVVADSKIGWASAFRELLSMLWAGKIPKWDTSKVRPAGARLKTFGGRASGPGPLNDLFNFTVNMVLNAVGRKLRPVECHDLVCKIAEIVVVGGVRRSALISLSDLNDEEMRMCKSGTWWKTHPHRALANNSAVYESKPGFPTFMNEWKSLYESYSGERGIFNRQASKNAAAKNGRRDTDYEFGTNPCSEIILRPHQFCNLSEVVVRSTDDLNDLCAKVEIATILGTLQSTLTNFRYLRKQWQRNTEEERLLGVSLTGICDHNVLNNPKHPQHVSWLKEMEETAVITNSKWASMLGIPASTAITCVKPSGTVSQLVNSASGIHPRYSPYYLRSVRNDIKDPICQFLIDQGIPHEPCVNKPDSQMVFYFPQKAPLGALCTKDVTAIDQMNLWLSYQANWCEHKPSITVFYKDDEFLQLGQFVWDHFDELSGVSFLPRDDHSYKQAPYQAITEEQYEEWLKKMPKALDWSVLPLYDKGQDNTEGVQTLACTGGNCEL